MKNKYLNFIGKILSTLPVFFLIASCAPSKFTPNKTQGKADEAPMAQGLPPNVHVAFSGTQFTLSPNQMNSSWNSSSEAQNWRAENLPPWLVLDATTGILKGLAPEESQYPNIKILCDTVSGPMSFGPFAIEVYSDPLFSNQWYLQNQGQKAFADNGGLSSQDIHGLPVFQNGYTGANFLIGVSDTAIEVNHEDLKNNTQNSYHRDYVKGKATSGYSGTPALSTSASNFHGTGVAGIIAAIGWNSLGIRGIAPKAKIASMNFIESDQSLNKLIDQITGPYDIINQSWGNSNQFPEVIEPEYLVALKNVTSTQRSGRGSLILKAAGNGYQTCGTVGFCPENANQDQYNNNPYTIVVGALNALGEHASYSSIGSSLWISAPGGEYGDTDPAMVTTDLSGCTAGLSKSTATENSFEKGSDSINKQCNYTSTFNGTSAATPVVSGAIALLLESRPDLTWRDIKHVLAKTARKVDLTSSTMTYDSGDPDPITFSLGWVTNGAGYSFHNEYGFGAMDLSAAITYARLHSPLPPADDFLLGSQTSINGAFGTSTAKKKEVTLVSSTDKTLETLELEASVSHSYFGDISIEVVSPAGTRSIVMTPFNTYGGSSNSNGVFAPTTHTYKLLSNAFYGEKSSGTWKIIFWDQIPQDEGSVISLTLRGSGY